MSAAAKGAPTVQQIILAEAGAMMKDVVGFLAIASFVVAVLIWVA
ncbi:hypothetical protein [Agrobacterium pusense]|jgi:hypothetical protein|nr:hypothetical protein [Agrobacterium pusense]MDH1268600.1 hypothetical protein [Agrobacterium pusense]